MNENDDIQTNFKKFSKMLRQNTDAILVEKFHVKYPDIFRKTLHEFDQMTGIDHVKQTLIRQMVAIFANGKNVILHSWFTGPPGVGKTTIAKMISYLWYGMGVIDPPIGRVIPQDETNQVYYPNTNGTPPVPIIQPGHLVDIVLDKFGLNAKPVLDTAQNDGILQTMGIDILALIFTVLFVRIFYFLTKRPINSLSKFPTLLIIIFVTYMFTKLILVKIKNHVEINTIQKYDTKRQVQYTNMSQHTEAENIFKVFAREDFIGKFSGHTADKTRILLEANIGKLIFIDEAYSLCLGSNDNFGMESITVINKFVEQNPHGTIVIMAGYQKQMQNLAKFQPGLPRRFPIQLKILGYTGEEMWLMFLAACKKQKIKIGLHLNIFFQDNIAIYMEYFGGDVKNFVDYLITEKDIYQFFGKDDTEWEIATEEHLFDIYTRFRKQSSIHN